MKRIGLLTLAFLLAPVAGFAQDAPPAAAPPAAMGAPGAPGRPDFAQMRQNRAQMEQLHLQARSAMLSALSPAHRTLLANIVGQLAISANPDPRAAAQQLDLALSAGEKQSVLTTESQLHTQMRAMMEADRARMEASLTPDQRSAMQARMAQRADRPQGEMRRQPDAGRALLAVVTHLGPPEGMHAPR